MAEKIRKNESFIGLKAGIGKSDSLKKFSVVVKESGNGGKWTFEFV